MSSISFSLTPISLATFSRSSFNGLNFFSFQYLNIFLYLNPSILASFSSFPSTRPNVRTLAVPLRNLKKPCFRPSPIPSATDRFSYATRALGSEIPNTTARLALYS